MGLDSDGQEFCVAKTKNLYKRDMEMFTKEKIKQNKYLLKRKTNFCDVNFLETP